MKRFMNLFLFLSFALFACTFPAQAENGKPRMVLTEVTYDAGEVFRTGEKLEHAFVIKNQGNANLEILSVTPG